MQVKVFFSPVFRVYFHCHERMLVIEKEEVTLIDLLQILSEETDAKINPLIFEGDSTLISAGLMIQVNDRTYTGNMLNQEPVCLCDRDAVSLLYYVSGG